MRIDRDPQGVRHHLFIGRRVFSRGDTMPAITTPHDRGPAVGWKDIAVHICCDNAVLSRVRVEGVEARNLAGETPADTARGRGAIEERLASHRERRDISV